MTEQQGKQTALLLAPGHWLTAGVTDDQGTVGLVVCSCGFVALGNDADGLAGAAVEHAKQLQP